MAVLKGFEVCGVKIGMWQAASPNRAQPSPGVLGGHGKRLLPKRNNMKKGNHYQISVWSCFFKMTIVIEQFLNMSKPSLIWMRNYNMYCLKDRALLQVTEHLSAICNSNELWKPRTIKWSEPDEVHWSTPTERYFMISIMKTPIIMPFNANWLATELNLRTNQNLSKDRPSLTINQNDVYQYYP